MLHVRYATQWPFPLSSLFSPGCRLSACLQLFALPLVDGVSAVADYALHQCEHMYFSVCVCVSVCECFYAMLIYFNSYLMSNVKAHGKREQKRKHWKLLPTSVRWPPAALPTIRNVHALRFCGTYETTTTVATWIIPSKWLKPTFQPVNNSLTASLRSGGLVCLISLHIVHIICDLVDLLFNLVRCMHALCYKYL